MRTIRVLSLDGGGIRGVLSARLLERIESARPGFLASVDLFAGTSTGGILALALAAGLAPSALVSLYRDQGARIFAKPWWTFVTNPGGLASPKYDGVALHDALVNVFGRMRLCDLQHKVLVPSFDVSRPASGGKPRMWAPKFFHNFGASEDLAELVVDVAMRTSAAPTYFPSSGRYVDGGVAANNPSLCALAQMMHPVAGAHDVDEVQLLSVSTGIVPHALDGENLHWGLAQWAPKVSDVLLDGDNESVDYQCKQLLGDAYMRLAPVLPHDVGLDDVSAVAELLALADKTPLEGVSSWLTQGWFEPAGQPSAVKAA